MTMYRFELKATKNKALMPYAPIGARDIRVE
jgi:hypothetical protein